MAKFIGRSCVAVLFIAVQPHWLSPARGAAAETDLSSPAKALAVFCKALETGDTVDLAAVSMGDAKLQEWARAEAGQLKSMDDLETALSKRFGANYAAADKGAELKDLIAETRDDDLHAALKHARLRARNADVMLLETDDSTPDDDEARLVRVEGRWKVDLASLSQYMALNDVPVMKAVAGTATDLARDVAAGKFAAIDDAADAVRERLSAAEAAALPKVEPLTRESPPRRRPAIAPK